MSKNDLSVYRSPAEGFSPEPQLVPDLTPWRCRWFGHKLRGETSPGWSIPFPPTETAPSNIATVWCVRCGREWKRDKAKK